jgi:hypothetical protein
VAKSGRKQISKAALAFRFDVARRSIQGLTIVLAILASALPLSIVADAVEPFAGEKTEVNVNLALTIAISVSVVVNGLQWLKSRSHRSEIRRLRQRIKTLEQKAGVKSG